jgi:hypothetical protein
MWLSDAPARVVAARRGDLYCDPLWKASAKKLAENDEAANSGGPGVLSATLREVA